MRESETERQRETERLRDRVAEWQVTLVWKVCSLISRNGAVDFSFHLTLTHLKVLGEKLT